MTTRDQQQNSLWVNTYTIQKQGKAETNYGVAGLSFAALPRLQDKIVNNLQQRDSWETQATRRRTAASDCRALLQHSTKLANVGTKVQVTRVWWSHTPWYNWFTPSPQSTAVTNPTLTHPQKVLFSLGYHSTTLFLLFPPQLSPSCLLLV